MPRFICDYCDCIHFDTFSCECQKDSLSVVYFMEVPGDDPKCYESYRNTPEYQQEYWINVKKQGVMYRSKEKGKRIEANGFVLYTNERVPPRELWESKDTAPVRCTEEKSGCGLYLHQALTRRDDVLKFIANVPPVMELPEPPKEEQ